MTTRTRRLAILAILVVAITIPTEVVFLQAITQDSRSAAGAWASSLSSDDLKTAASRIDQLPIQYRKALLRRLGPQAGAEIWTRHITRYRDAHPELSKEQVSALNAVLGLISTETFTFPTTEERAASTVMADRIGELFGEDVKRFLMHDLGPRSVTFMTQATPIRQRLQDFVREHFVVNAGDGARCDCVDYYECDSGRTGSSICSPAATSGCTLDSSWPACGFLWLEECSGRCQTMQTN